MNGYANNMTLAVRIRGAIVSLASAMVSCTASLRRYLLSTCLIYILYYSAGCGSSWS